MKFHQEAGDDAQRASDKFAEALESVGYKNVCVFWSVEKDGIIASGNSNSPMTYEEIALKLFLISGSMHDNLRNEN